jgi:hypothetical protein
MIQKGHEILVNFESTILIVIRKFRPKLFRKIGPSNNNNFRRGHLPHRNDYLVPRLPARYHPMSQSNDFLIYIYNASVEVGRLERF